MAKQDDRNRLDAVAAVIALHDKIKELEVQLEYLQFKCDSLTDELTDIKFPE